MALHHIFSTEGASLCIPDLLVGKSIEVRLDIVVNEVLHWCAHTLSLWMKVMGRTAALTVREKLINVLSACYVAVWKCAKVEIMAVNFTFLAVKRYAWINVISESENVFTLFKMHNWLLVRSTNIVHGEGVGNELHTEGEDHFIGNHKRAELGGPRGRHLMGGSDRRGRGSVRAVFHREWVSQCVVPLSG